MDDKDFLLIKTLYEEQNITHTAKKLFISQPAISDRLKRLEAEFGCQLFIRQPRGILFTSQGEMLVQYVNEADERYQKIRSALAKPVGKAFGSLSIACSNVFAKYHMPSLLSEFKKKYPAIDISLKSGFSTNRYKDFLEGRFHVCIIRGEHNWSEHKKRLLRDPLCVFSRDPIDLKKLPHLPFVHYITDPALQLVMDASNTNTAQAGAAYLRSVLQGDAAGMAGVETRLLYNPRMKSAYNFVPGIMGLIFILICAIMTSVSIVREKETGTMEVLLVSPVRPIRIVFAKMIPYFVLSCLNLASILLLARFVLGVPMSGGIVGIVGLSLLYIVLALALGLFISTVARTQVTALLVSAMLMLMPMIMLSGMVFPIGNMPAPLRWLSCIVPARWYIAAIRRLMIEGLPFTAVLREFAILAAMTAGLIAVALRKFNDKLE